MNISFHIHFNGTCQDAFEFYATLLDGQIGTMLPFCKSPAADSVPADWQNKIVHANIKLHGIELAGDDLPPGLYQPPKGFYVLLSLENEEKTKAVFEALAAGGEVLFPLQPTFWSPCYGIVVDRFGVAWKLNCVA